MDKQAWQNAEELLKARDYRAAERAFGKLMEHVDEHDKQYNILQSYYGLTRTLNGDGDGLLLCRDAAGSETSDGRVFLNLACAEWYSDNRKRAVDAIRQGVKIDPENPSLKKACTMLDCRRRCCFNFLPRNHSLNRFFGRLRRKPAAEITVHSLLY